jgi:hypothetical protein
MGASLISLIRDRRSSRVLAALAFGSAVAFSTPSHGANPSAEQKALALQAQDAFCGLNLRYIEAISEGTGFNVTRTTCRIASYRKGLMILFTAEQPVFRVPATRKAWAMIAVLSAGKTIRDLGGSLIGVDYVGLTDSEQAQSGKIVRLPASFAEQLQAAVHDGKVDALVALENLDRRLQRGYSR